MPSPSSSFKKASPQQYPSPMPSTNRKMCLRLPTYILFTSTSLRFPTVNRQCLPFAHPSYPWFKPPKVSQLYLIFAQQYRQPPHFKVCSDQLLQLLNVLHFGRTDLLYALVKVTHPSKVCTSQINRKIWLCSTLANFTPSKIYK